jgi:cell division protein FtsZ
MMGTGEASGDKRALSAAEAAISNPLIDETSMKGAKGLLISITGGKDLTLYEVDEAATRIREEVDNEANIIVGATFDESLDGIVRVSVVATGIDIALSAYHPANTRQPIAQAAAPAPVQAAAPSPAPQAVAAASRLAELTQSLRASNQRMAERAEQRTATNDQAHRAVAQALAAPGETAAPAPVAAAPAEPMAPPRPQVTAIEDVTIRPMPPKPTLFVESFEEYGEQLPAPPPAAAPEAPFIPPQAERPAMRAPRMPRIDELPIPAQNQLRAKRGGGNDADHPEKRRMTLLQRLASVGLGRKEEHTEEAADYSAPPRPSAPPAFDRPPARPLHRPNDARPPDPVSEYAKRAPQGLDPMGRQTPVHNSTEEDQLDIPAFLRRQAN